MQGVSLAPRIETERLLLRGHRLGDFDDCARMWSEPDVTRFIGGAPSSLQETWFRLLRYAGHWTLLGYGYWVIEERRSGRFAGEIGFGESKRDIKPSLAGMPESGWALASWAQGQGFASEALSAALIWGDGDFEQQSTCCIISPDNLPSLRVAAKNGYVVFARTAYKGASTIVFRRPRGHAP